MFPKVRKAELDLATLGVALAARKEELLAEMTDDADDAPGAPPKRKGRTR
jgi:hypothetical protein